MAVRVCVFFGEGRQKLLGFWEKTPACSLSRADKVADPGDFPLLSFKILAIFLLAPNFNESYLKINFFTPKLNENFISRCF